jgi:hypothetical protein
MKGTAMARLSKIEPECEGELSTGRDAERNRQLADRVVEVETAASQSMFWKLSDDHLRGLASALDELLRGIRGRAPDAGWSWHLALTFRKHKPGGHNPPPPPPNDGVRPQPLSAYVAAHLMTVAPRMKLKPVRDDLRAKALAQDVVQIETTAPDEVLSGLPERHVTLLASSLRALQQAIQEGDPEEREWAWRLVLTSS